MVYVKALHLIFMVSWFAALFYMPRLLIYHVEAQKKDTYERSILSEQFKIMQKRLWMFIAWPAMTLTWIFGLWTSWYTPYNYLEAWFILKLIFVFALSLYHLQTHMIFKKQQKDIFPWTSFRLRLWNEVATVLLFIIIFLVVLKQNSGWVYGTLGVIMFGVALFAAVVIYRRNREKTEEPKDPGSEPPPPPVPPAL